MAIEKTKFEYEIEEFESAFYDKKHLRIVLYGAGRMTATLLRGIKGFYIVGILDRDSSMIGRQIYGMRVMSREEAERNADMIVINTSESYWNTIYQRIMDWKLPIYFRNGERAQLSSHQNMQESYWLKGYKELEEKVEKYEVISFDIFDTLVMRKVHLPEDIFLLVENKINKEYQMDSNFAQWRKMSASLSAHSTIDEIYSKMQELTGWEEQKIAKAKSYEITTEIYFLTPRQDILKLYQALQPRKEVFLISDMYYSKKDLLKILAGIGIDVPENHLLVSCDLRRTKESGMLWEYYSHNIVRGRNAIHIGDNEIADDVQPRKYGIDSWRIWSSADLLQKSSIRNIAPYVNSIHTSIVMGLLEAKVFNSPFCLHETKGKVLFQNEAETGYCLLGVLLYEFLSWLHEQAETDNVRRLVFFAREGYLLTQLFAYYCKLVSCSDTLQGIYLEISRRAVLIASVESLQDIRDAAHFPYKGKTDAFFKDRFGINPTDEELQDLEWRGETGNGDKLLEKYSQLILKEAKRERDNYKKYLKEMGLESNFAIVDSLLYGSTQYYLGKLLGRKLSGYYFCVCLDPTNKYLKSSIMKGCFSGSKKIDGKDSNLYKQAPFLEAFFTAPNGMFEYIEDDGSKRYTEKMKNQEEFDIRLEMIEGVKAFIKEMTEIQNFFLLNKDNKDPGFADKLFGEFMDDGFEVSDRMKKSFWYDNRIMGIEEVPLWE